jgi:hypothetical protein
MDCGNLRRGDSCHPLLISKEARCSKEVKEGPEEMRTLTGTKAIMSLAAVAVAFSAFYVVTRKEDGNVAQVAAVWAPSPRPDGVSILVTVGKSNKVDKTETVAPFNRSYHAVSGEIVRIRLRLKGTSVATLIGCSVVLNGIEEMTLYKKPNSSEGFIECYGVMP